MADLASLLLALGISSGVHPLGHFQTGNDLNVPVDVNWGQRTESWNTPDKRKDSEIAGGGFGIQDKLAQGLGQDDSSMRLANALYKLGYMSKLTLPQSSLAYGGGDVEQMQRESGNKYTKSLLGASALFDLWKSQNPKSNFDLQFVAPNGSPGLMGTWRF